MKVKGPGAVSERISGIGSVAGGLGGPQIASCELVSVVGGSERSVVAAICAGGVAVDGGRRR